MPPEEIMKKEEMVIRKDEREKVLNELITFCETCKEKLMNLSIPLRDRPLRALNDVIQHCCELENIDDDN
jgi:hypothetical protein